MTPVSITSCNFTENFVSGNGIIYADMALLLMNNSVMHNNSVYETSCIVFYHAFITLCTFTNNTIESDIGLIASAWKSDSRLQVKESIFLYNQGNMIRVEGDVDIVLNSCNFTGNSGERGTLFIQDDGTTVRTSNTTVIAATEGSTGNKVAVYFAATTKQTIMTDYMTHDTCFISGNTTLNSSSTEIFLQEASILL